MQDHLQIYDQEDPDQPSIHIDLVPFGNPLIGDNSERYSTVNFSEKS